MTKVPALDVPSSAVHRGVRDIIESQTTILNEGKYQGNVRTAIPTEQANVGEFVFVDDGATRRVCTYFGSTVGWLCATMS